MDCSNSSSPVRYPPFALTSAAGHEPQDQRRVNQFGSSSEGGPHRAVSDLARWARSRPSHIQLGSNEGALTSDIPTDDQGLDLGRSFVRDEAFHIAHMTYDVEIERDAIAAEDVARHPADFARLDAAVILGQRGHRFLQFAVVNQATKSDAIELHRRDVAKHVDEHRLDHLRLGDRSTELDPAL